MTILIVTLLVVISIVVLAYPFLAYTQGRTEDTADELAQQLRRARNRVYEEIRALQQEYFLGSMSQEEYQAQLHAARLRAADLLREQRSVQETVERIEREVEEEMRRAQAATEHHAVNGTGKETSEWPTVTYDRRSREQA